MRCFPPLLRPRLRNRKLKKKRAWHEKIISGNVFMGAERHQRHSGALLCNQHRQHRQLQGALTKPMRENFSLQIFYLALCIFAIGNWFIQHLLNNFASRYGWWARKVREREHEQKCTTIFISKEESLLRWQPHKEEQRREKVRMKIMLEVGRLGVDLRQDQMLLCVYLKRNNINSQPTHSYLCAKEKCFLIKMSQVKNDHYLAQSLSLKRLLLLPHQHL